MCVTVIYFLLVKLIIFFLSFYIYILLPVMVNKDFHKVLSKMGVTYMRDGKYFHQI